MTTVRRLNSNGLSGFRALLASLREQGGKASLEAVQGQIDELLTSADYSEPVDYCKAEVDESTAFPSRYRLGACLVQAFGHCDQAPLEEDGGLWSWLALLYIGQLIPPSSKIPQDENFVPPEDWWDLRNSPAKRWGAWGRHAIRTTYLLVREYGEAADFLLAGPMHSRGELVEQLTGRAYLLPCGPAVRAMALLYRDHGGRPKRGAASKSRGAARSFGLLAAQLMVNYDLHEMEPKSIVDILPEEFDRFRPAPS